MVPVDSGRITRRYVQHIAAPPARVFPLLCPVREAEWLDGWRDGVEIIHSESGLGEAGCVFRTKAPGRPETVWMITHHDPVERVVEFHRVTTGLVATRLRIAVEAGAGERSDVHVAYTLTPLGETGVAFLRDAFAEEAFRRDMEWWESSMNHWLTTGEILRARAS